MRYRPFHSAGLSISCLTLDVPTGLSVAEVQALTETALQGGVNAFCVSAADASALGVLRDVVADVGRGLLVLLARLPQGSDPTASVEGALRLCGATLFDAALVETEEPAEFSAMSDRLETVRAAGLARRLGFLARGEEAGCACLDVFPFDVLAFRFNLMSGWPERNLLRKAASRGMTILGSEPHPSGLAEGDRDRRRPGLAGLLKGRTARWEDGYSFLNRTQGWTPEQITLAFALTEPRLASVLVRTDRPELLQALTEVPDRELPPNIAAQIEMARFSRPPARKAG